MIRVLGVLTAALLLTAAPGVKRRAAPTPAESEYLPGKPVTGVGVHFCSCSAPCPCMFRPEDMEGCNLTAVYHFTSGGYAARGKKDTLSGLTLVVAYRPAALQEGASAKDLAREGIPVGTVIYLPQGISQEQEEALRFIYAEHLLGTGLGSGAALFRKAPIEWKPTGGGYRVRIPGILEAVTEPILGANKRQMAVDNVDFLEGSRWYLGKATRHVYQDPVEKAWKWELPDSNGAWTRFSWRRINRG